MFKELNNLKIFFESPTREFNVREFARILKISPATASTLLRKYAKEDLIIERKDRNFIFYKANLESEYYQNAKKYYIIIKIRESGLIEELNKFYIKPTIILFGSVSNGMDVENSDLDLVVISEKKAEFKETEKFEKNLKREIQIFSVKDIKELKNPHLINNVLNGTVLQGEIKWI